MPTDPHRPSSEPRQHVWPIFALAAALLAFGSYFVFFTAPAPAAAPEQLPASFIDVTPTPPTEAPEQPLALAYRATDRRFELDLRQRQTRGTHSVSTWLRSVAVDTVEPGKDDAPFDLLRDYDRTRVATYADGVPVGADIVDEVERLIDASGHRIRLDVTGAVLDAEITSEEGAHVRTLLNLLEEAAGMLFVRVPREAVRVGEPWSWSIPSKLVEPNGLAAVTGNTDIEAQIVGEDADSAVVIAVQVRGALSVSLEDGAIETKSAITGEGWFRWDQQRGGPVQSELHLTRTETVGGEVVTTEYILRLRALNDRE